MEKKFSEAFYEKAILFEKNSGEVIRYLQRKTQFEKEEFGRLPSNVNNPDYLVMVTREVDRAFQLLESAVAADLVGKIKIAKEVGDLAAFKEFKEELDTFIQNMRSVDKALLDQVKELIEGMFFPKQ